MSAAKPKKLRARENDDLGTPEWLLALERKLGPIVLDPCSNPWSIVDAKMSYSLDEGQNGLALPWSPKVTGKGIVHCNYPYGPGHPLPWWRKIAVESAGGAEIVVIGPVTASTEAWKVGVDSMNARVLLDERVKFLGGKHDSGQIDTAIWYAGPKPYLFLHHFAPLGEETFFGHGRRAA